MPQSTTGKVRGLLLSGLAATGMFTALGSAPTAQASCVSAFGLSSNPAQCSSSIAGVAIAIGTNAQAHADGLLGAAFTFGDNSEAIASSSASIAFNIGQNSAARAGGVNGVTEFLNVALQLGGTTSSVFARGGAVNLGINLGGTLNGVYAGSSYGGSLGNLAIGAFNTDTAVAAGRLALAAGFFQTGSVIQKQKPGININGFKLPPNSAASTPPAAGTRGSTGRPAAASTATTAHPAAATNNRNR